MQKDDNVTRRSFFSKTAGSLALLACADAALHAQSVQAIENQRMPYKIGIRQASLKNPDNPKERMDRNLDTFKLARRIPGITGVEVQCAPGLRDLDLARKLKAQAHKWGMEIPSASGAWDPGTIKDHWGPAAGIELLQAVRASEILGASVLLVPFFRQSAPDMASEDSYGPVVELLKMAAPHAADAGVTLGLESSLSPADHKKLIDLVDHPNVKVYYDPDNMLYYGHTGQEVPGLERIGNEGLCMVHVKNQDKLIETPGRIDWQAALKTLGKIGYDGWLMFESQHDSFENCLRNTTKNIEFIKKHFQPPLG